VRSVVEGLRAIGADFNFNPRAWRRSAGRLRAGESALRQAAGLKRAGTSIPRRRPVNALFRDDCDGVLLLPEIDRLIVASEWALGFYRDAPQLLAKSVSCPCGIDADTGSRRDGRARTRGRVLEERRRAFCEQVEQIVRTCGWSRAAALAGPASTRFQPG
jgi:hypothetical protein